LSAPDRGSRSLRALRLALDQRHAEVFLELADLRGQRGLAHEAALGGPAEVPLVGQRHEVAEVAEVHGQIIASLYRVALARILGP